VETQVIQGLTDLLITIPNLAIMVAAGIIMSVLRKMLPELFKKKYVARGLPLYPILLCIGLIWIPGFRPTMVVGETSVPMSVGATLVLALILGGLVGHVYKILFQTVLGRGVAASSKPDEDSPAA